MRGDVDLRDIRFQKLRLSPRALLLLGILALLVAGAFLGWRYLNHPPRPWLVRWKLDRYLKKEAHSGNFKVDFPFPSKAEMARPKKPAADLGLAKGARTGKEFDTLRSEYFALKREALRLEQNIGRRAMAIVDETGAPGATTPPSNETNITPDPKPSITVRENAARVELEAKEQALAPITDDLWDFQRRWAAESGSPEGGTDNLARARADFARSIEQKIESAASYEAMYLAIGQELFVAKGLLKSHNPAHQKMAMTIAFTAARHALNHAVNGNVAARICEGYLLPNLDLATDTNPRSPFHQENFLNQCADLFRRNNEFDNVVRTYEMYLAGAKNPARADWARSQVATAYEDGGDPKMAIATIRQIRDTNAYSRLIRRIPRLEQDAGLER
jgi:hypothetical protein